MKAFFAAAKTFLLAIFRLLLVVLALALVAVSGYFAKELAGTSTPYVKAFWEARFGMNWQQRIIAGLAFETPKPLVKQKGNVDPEMVTSRALYSEFFGSQHGQLKIMLYHVCFKSGVPLHLDGAAEGMGNNLVEQFGQENCTFDTSHTVVSGQPAIIVSASGRSETESGYVKGVVVAKNTDMWSLIVVYSDKFPNGSDFSDRILGSITIASTQDSYHDSLLQAALQNAKLNSKDIAELAYPAVVTVIARSSNGSMKGFGSGFFLTKDLVVTNYHVIRDADSASVVLVGEDSDNAVIGAVASDTSSDLAILKVATPNESFLPVDTCNAGSVGDEVYAVGNPEGLQGTISSGIISAIRGTDGSVYQITAPISKGSSGGPVIGSNGKVVGISVGMLSKGQNLNFAIPSCYLLSLYSKAGKPTPLSLLRLLDNLEELLAGEDLEEETPTQTEVASTEPITASTLYWDNKDYVDYHKQWGIEYSFSLHNNTQRTVNNIDYLVKFFDTEGTIINSVERKLYTAIRPNMAKRVSGKADWATFALSVDYTENYGQIRSIGRSRISVEILNFEYSY